jgi:hypothetical protein
MNKASSEKWFYSDTEFHALYPLSIQALARYHWTPLSVAQKAATFLAGEGNVNILDIGSGVGKFCLAAASHTPNGKVYLILRKRPEKTCNLKMSALCTEISPNWISKNMIISISTMPFMKTWMAQTRSTTASIIPESCTIITIGIYLGN